MTEAHETSGETASEGAEGTSAGYLIDTDWIIDFLANDPAAVALVSTLARQQIAISIITCMEAYQGTLRAPDPTAAQARVATFVRTVRQRSARTSDTSAGWSRS